MASRLMEIQFHPFIEQEMTNANGHVSLQPYVAK